MIKNRATLTEPRLFEIAEAQQGLFTVRQAREAGYGLSSRHHHVKVGNWKRLHRGIYRLSRYPVSDDEQLMKWFLWSHNSRGEPQGIYSHETALVLHGLSDIMPPKLHMTVPLGFRRNSALPKVLVLHRANLQNRDIEEVKGFKVTRPLRTVLDVAMEGRLSRDFVRQALDEALAKGLIARYQLKEAQMKTVPGWLQEMIRG